MAQATQFFQMDVADASGAEMASQGFAIELGIVAGARNAADVYDALHAVRLQKLDEFLERPSGMADGEDRCMRFFARRRHGVSRSD